MRCKNCNKLIELGRHGYYEHVETDDNSRWWGCKAANVRTYKGSDKDRAEPGIEYNVLKLLNAIDSHTTNN